ncbi:MAG: hydrogenase iron-sulfur subunit [Deltaproteobacteria bacterium]|nr:hydrogenase iron-sulfur subunit [Deltaproteobacteria bacterium]
MGECHYLEGNVRAKSRAEAIYSKIKKLDLEPERFRLEWIAASEAARFVNIVKDMTDTLKALGANPYKNRRGDEDSRISGKGDI